MSQKYFLMRHGYAGLNSPDPMLDKTRPLTPQGELDVTGQAYKLASMKKKPDAIYTDGTVRTAQTANIVANALGLQACVAVDDRLGSADTIQDAIDDATDLHERPLLVTHHHVIAALDDDTPDYAEIRRYKNGKEKDRIQK